MNQELMDEVRLKRILEGKKGEIDYWCSRVTNLAASLERDYELEQGCLVAELPKYVFRSAKNVSHFGAFYNYLEKMVRSRALDFARKKEVEEKRLDVVRSMVGAAGYPFDSDELVCRWMEFCKRLMSEGQQVLIEIECGEHIDAATFDKHPEVRSLIVSFTREVMDARVS